jgi:hypothetical protein
MIDRQSKAARQALLLGILGVAIFGLTLPATRLAVAELDPLFVTAGRSLVAAALASLTLLWARPPAPLRREWPRLAAFAAFSIIGFPLLRPVGVRGPRRLPHHHLDPGELIRGPLSPFFMGRGDACRTGTGRIAGNFVAPAKAKTPLCSEKRRQ